MISSAIRFAAFSALATAITATSAPVLARTTPLSGMAIRSLAEKAAREGTIRVIIRVRLPEDFVPEGRLPQSDRAVQRRDIHDAQRRLLRKHRRLSVSTGERFGAIPFVLATIDADTLRELADDDDVLRIDEDVTMGVALADSIAKISAPAVWSLGPTGAGWTIAQLDSGVDRNHPFLAGKVIQEACFSSTSANGSILPACPAGMTSGTSTTQVGPGAAAPCIWAAKPITCQHGTFTAGVAVGKNGSFQGRTFSGVAVDATLLPIQVFTGTNCHNGTCADSTTYESDQLRAMQWIHDTARHDYLIAAVNISLANPFYSDDQAECDQFGGNGAAAGAYAAMVATLRADGIPVVIGAGNDNNPLGPSFPSCVSGAISVGAVDKNDQLWVDPLTGAGTNSGQLMDMWAPGGGGTGGNITGDYTKGIVSSKPGSSYEAHGGTSLAAPHVAGALAVLRQHWPNLSVDTLIDAVVNHGPQITDPRNSVTRHRLDLLAAYNWLADTEPPTTPTNLEASATSTSSVHLRWSSSTDNQGVDHYEVERRSSIVGAWSNPMRADTTSFDDGGRAAATAYQYRVRAVDMSSHSSPWSATDIATTVMFTNNPLHAASGTGGGSLIVGAHIAEVRQAIDAWRVLANLPRAWSSYQPLTGRVYATDISLLFASPSRPYDEARSLLGYSPFAYHDGVSVPANGGWILRDQVQQIRDSLN